MTEFSEELWDLLNALCEQRLTPAQAARLEQLVLASPVARTQFLAYLDLHGTLYWDAAAGLAISRLPAEALASDAAPPVLVSRSAETSRSSRKRWTNSWVGLAGLAAAVAVVVLWQPWDYIPGPTSPVVVVPLEVDTNTDAEIAEMTPHGHRPRQPVQLSTTHPAASGTEPDEPGEVATMLNPATPLPDRTIPVAVQRPVALINQELQAGWQAAGIAPTERADDAAWLRRVYLDLTGHIPSAAEVKQFLSDRRGDKREKLIDRLLDDPDFVRQLSTQWANLLVGRSPSEAVNLPALRKFLRTSFAANRGWDEIVTDLVAAEGRADENGAANFLIAHLNNQAVPATAITARLFLGMQVQCTQCHNHPSGVAKQVEFWEFNSFFQQTQSILLTERNPQTGEIKSQVAELVSEPEGGPTYYETNNGVMKVAYPKYHGKEISPEPTINRRRELARLLAEDDGAQLAAAFVNRTWQHFFGYGFTRPIDDMGPHNPASHPELLAGLSEAFRQSGYDIKQLTRWICLSDAYQLSSRFGDSNQIDDPERGEVALFSRVYPQPMTVEQLYDSFLVATHAHQHRAGDWTAAEAQRQVWLQQFVISFQTEENDEANTFEGTVTQALTMMNGPLVEKALEPTGGTYLSEVLRGPGSDSEKIEMLCLAALSRKPHSRELAAMQKLVRKSTGSEEGYQDLFWALLNSNEFAVVY